LRGVESAAASWDSKARGYDFISHTGRRLRDAQDLMKVADFRTHINRNSTVKDYLKAATRAARGWRIASWYTLAYFGVVTISAAISMAAAYATGYYSVLPIILLSVGLAVFIYGPLTACFAYLAALLRQIALRSGFYSDIVVLSLAAIFCLAWIVVYTLLIYHGGAEGMGAVLRQQEEKQGASFNLYQGLDDKTIGTLNMAGNFPLLLMLFPLSWAALQLLWLVTVPFSFLARKGVRTALNIAKFARRPAR
jgi:hypothetical protein